MSCHWVTQTSDIYRLKLRQRYLQQKAEGMPCGWSIDTQKKLGIIDDAHYQHRKQCEEWSEPILQHCQNTSKAISEIHQKHALEFQLQNEKKHQIFLENLEKEKQERGRRRIEREKELEQKFLGRDEADGLDAKRQIEFKNGLHDQATKYKDSETTLKGKFHLLEFALCDKNFLMILFREK